MLTTAHITLSAYTQSKHAFHPSNGTYVIRDQLIGTTVPSWAARSDLVVFSKVSDITTSSDPYSWSDSCEYPQIFTDSLKIMAYDSNIRHEIDLLMSKVDINTLSIAFDNQALSLLLCCNGVAYLVDIASKKVLQYDPQVDPFAIEWITEDKTPGELIICGSGHGLAVVRDGHTAWIVDLPSGTSHQDGITFAERKTDPTKLHVTALDRESVIFSCASSKIIAHYQKNGHYWRTARCPSSRDSD